MGPPIGPPAPERYGAGEFDERVESGPCRGRPGGRAS
jgi:hypothetical protein